MALDDVLKYGELPIPLKIRNAPTKLMQELGYGEEYQKYPATSLVAGDTASYLPEKLKWRKYLKGS